jgi:hypothetical protein
MMAVVRRLSWLNLVAVAMIVTGIVVAFVGHDTLRWAPPPLPPAWAATGKAPAATALTGSAARRPTRSEPVSIDIPAIKVHTRLIDLGLSKNGTIDVPPLSKAKLAGWYDRGPGPGQPGAAAILGHVDAAGIGPAVFYNLGNLRPGAKVYVHLRDGQTVVFETYSVALYSKTKFPTAKVFGYTSWPTLRLITCGGLFDQQSGHYLGNVVAFASYVGTYR